MVRYSKIRIMPVMLYIFGHKSEGQSRGICEDGYFNILEVPVYIYYIYRF